jgi:hypothetical protein
MSLEARKAYDDALDSMFEKNIAKQPPEFRNRATSIADKCKATHDGYGCTLKAGHTCDHVAHGRLGYIHHRWNDAGQVSTVNVLNLKNDPVPRTGRE